MLPERSKLEFLLADPLTPIGDIFEALSTLEKAVEATEATKERKPVKGEAGYQPWSGDSFYYERIGGTIEALCPPPATIRPKVRRWTILDQEWNVFNNTVIGKVKPIRVPCIDKVTKQKIWRVACHKMVLHYKCHDGSVEEWTLVMIRRKGCTSFAFTQLQFGTRLIDKLSGEWEEIPYTDRACPLTLRDMLCSHMLPAEADDVISYWHEHCDFETAEWTYKNSRMAWKQGVNGADDRYGVKMATPGDDVFV